MLKEVARIDCGVIARAAAGDDDYAWVASRQFCADCFKSSAVGDQACGNADRLGDLAAHDRPIPFASCHVPPNLSVGAHRSPRG